MLVVNKDSDDEAALEAYEFRLDQFSSVEEAYNDGMSRLEALVSRVHDIVPPQLPLGSIKLSTSPFGPSLSQSTMTREGYQRAVRQAKEHILAESQHGLGPGGNHRASKFSSGSLFNRSYIAISAVGTQQGNALRTEMEVHTTVSGMKFNRRLPKPPTEIVLRVKQGDNPTFGFLMPDNYLHVYFRYLVDHPKLLHFDIDGNSQNEREKAGSEHNDLDRLGG
ncbi:unnamed protein product [Fraxinus pennsylvanica]|uniref:SURP motif domain-containing protein n=1 Tax=Fraxinus pennsylvanica TaxID=56036 RepID=A0AAD2E7L0_9LAMI|nr:unnamed protein product [Fraxinus pennsylvanica]